MVQSPVGAAEGVIQRAHFQTTAEEYWDDGDHTKGVLDDNFDSTVREEINQPTPEATISELVSNSIEGEGADQDVVLWRGVSAVNAAAIEANQSAGGVAADAATARPTQAQAAEQVQQGHLFPEYSTATNSSWSAGSWLIVVRINTQYLRRGSQSENGWIALPSAPLTVLDTVDRSVVNPQQLGGVGQGFGGANAS